MTNPPIDLAKAWTHHVGEVLADRDPHRISGSDLHGCDYAFWTRYNGEVQLPYDGSSFSAFERGHAYETRCFDAVHAYLLSRSPVNLNVTRWESTPLVHDGIEGHPDLLLRDADGTIIATIDPTTTASKFTEWKYGHALKSAFYAMALGCDTFCEWVFSIGFGGNILAQEAHWFSLGDIPFASTGLTWRDLVELSSAHVKAVSSLSDAPNPPMPPIDPTDGTQEAWRCGKPGSGKSYCRALCPRNAQYQKLTA